jgi:inner membrane protease subunit 2
MRASSFWGRVGGPRAFLADASYYLTGFVFCIPLGISFNYLAGTTITINGPSMYPLLNDRYNESRARDLCWNYKFRARESLDRGMVVTFLYVILAPNTRQF